ARSFNYQPLLSIVTPVFNTPPHMLRAMLESVRAQTYANWELCLVDAGSSDPEVHQIVAEAARTDARVKRIVLERNLGIALNSNAGIEQAQGEFIVLLDHDDTLAPFALHAVAERLNQNREWDVLYSDHDLLSENGRTRSKPLLKPGWSPSILLSANYMTHLTVLRTSLVRQVGGFREGMDGAQDWDLFLRLVERTKHITHIPQILYHWRDSAQSTATDDQHKPYARRAQLKAIRNHLERQGLSEPRAFVDGSGFIRVAWGYERTAKVSIIVPSEGANARLERCIQSLATTTYYPNIEIVIVNNGQRRPDEFEYYRKLADDPRVRIVHDERPFNYSAANNFGVRHASGDILLFLNNDTQALVVDWLDEMVMWLSRKQVGV
ncbi:MAG: glycosyltransferase, partial [Chloroflexi bacterium]|nr:glycosyltransferase [Chloroflexota bacterium]